MLLNKIDETTGSRILTFCRLANDKCPELLLQLSRYPWATENELVDSLMRQTNTWTKNLIFPELRGVIRVACTFYARWTRICMGILLIFLWIFKIETCLADFPNSNAKIVSEEQYKLGIILMQCTHKKLKWMRMCVTVIWKFSFTQRLLCTSLWTINPLLSTQNATLVTLNVTKVLPHISELSRLFNAFL